ncbi:MAG: hypothetical protein WC592_06250 [Candidatus Omnitrophota bacterium]
MKIIKMLMVGACLLYFSSTAYPEEKNTTAKPAAAKISKKDAPARKPVSQLTKEELIEQIKFTLENDPEVLDYIPEIKAIKDKQDNISYQLSGKKLEMSDKETLLKFFNRINNEVGRLRAEVLNRQLEAARASQQAVMAAHQQAVINAQVQAARAGQSRPPVILQVPKTPSAPASVPQVPKTPPQPPSIPRR